MAPPFRLLLLICIAAMAEPLHIESGFAFSSTSPGGQNLVRMFQAKTKVYRESGARAPEVLMMAKQEKQEKKSFVANLPPGAERPSLVVFDLDNTLWTPELYQLKRTPKADKDIYLFDGAKAAMKELATEKNWEGSQFALASRTNKGDWAFNLLTKFVIDEESGKTMDDLFTYKQIFTGTKRKHFDNLRKETGIRYEDMIFFDDSTMNTVEIERMGVLCVYCPKGLTSPIWQNGLNEFAKMKQERSPFMGRTVSAPNEAPIQSTTIIVPSETVGRLIGKMGATIKSLQAETGATIRVDKKPNAEHETKVLITGTPQAVAEAKKAVGRICGQYSQ